MPARIVDHFRLPWRRLPGECGAGAFLALADGPSSQEYDLSELRSSGATIVCYGRIAGSIRPDYYLLADLGFAEVLEQLPPTRVLVSRDGPYGGEQGARHWRELCQTRGHEYQWAPRECAHHPVLNCLALGAASVFLLGHDGYHLNNGRLASASHAADLHDTTAISRQRYAQRPRDERQADFWVTDINRISWDMTIKAAHKVQGIAPQIYNLSLASRHRPVWDVHANVLEQPFGRIDRRGSALVVHILDTDAEIESLDLRPAAPRARWGPLHFGNHAEFINNLRRIEPHLAIYVRTDTKIERLASLLADDIQIGGLQVPFEQGLHANVAHFRLPPINDHWD